MLARDNADVNNVGSVTRGDSATRNPTEPGAGRRRRRRVGGGLAAANWEDALSRAEQGLTAARGKVAAIRRRRRLQDEEGWLIQRIGPRGARLRQTSPAAPGPA